MYLFLDLPTISVYYLPPAQHPLDCQRQGQREAWYNCLGEEKARASWESVGKPLS